MEISCPSCGVRHRTEDYPNAFDIQCSCGYSILVPDEKALAEPEIVPSFENNSNNPSIPTAMEEEDQQMAISAEDFRPSEAIEALPGSNEMTAPDQLPEGMVYDPFELPEIPEDLAQKLDQRGDFDSGDAVAGGSATEIPMLDDPFAEPLEVVEIMAKPLPVREPDPARIIERSQVATLGQLLGPDYNLEAGGLGDEQRTWITDRCRKFLGDRPWLEEELRARRVDFAEFEKTSRIEHVPEILAVEIYLMCFEVGGSCSFRKDG